MVAAETGRVLTHWEGSSPRWSPNGREIASAGSRDGRNGIWVRQIESGTDRFLVETPQSNARLGRGAAKNFEWWPDGQWIAFVAAGGVIGYPSLAATSSERGRLAACHALGAPTHPMAPHFPIGIYAIPEISMVGEPEHVLTKKKVPYEVGIARYREIARGQILGDGDGLLKLLFAREDRRLLGVPAIGTGATELLHIGQTVIGLGGGLDYFLRTVFNCPTLAEC